MGKDESESTAGTQIVADPINLRAKDSGSDLGEAKASGHSQGPMVFGPKAESPTLYCIPHSPTVGISEYPEPGMLTYTGMFRPHGDGQKL
jgi:hypothetical protein